MGVHRIARDHFSPQVQACQQFGRNTDLVLFDAGGQLQQDDPFVRQVRCQEMFPLRGGGIDGAAHRLAVDGNQEAVAHARQTLQMRAHDLIELLRGDHLGKETPIGVVMGHAGPGQVKGGAKRAAPALDPTGHPAGRILAREFRHYHEDEHSREGVAQAFGAAGVGHGRQPMPQRGEINRVSLLLLPSGAYVRQGRLHR